MAAARRSRASGGPWTGTMRGRDTATPERRPLGLPRALDVRAGERTALLLSFAYFFALLCGYYLLRPVREEMGIRGGVEKLHWVFTATFAVMLAALPVYSAVVARVPRARAVPLVYRFFVLSLLVFWALLRSEVAPQAVARAFFVWVSVYNLFVVAVFWSFMADVFTSDQARRLFGVVAAGGSAGAIAGPLLAALLVGPLGVPALLLASAVLLEASARCASALARWARRGGAGGEGAAGAAGEPVGGGAFAGFALVFRSRYLLAIALQTLFTTAIATFVYFEQARIVGAALRDASARTRLFATLDLAVNVTGLGLQALVAGPLIARAGVAVALAIHPLIATAGLVAIAAAPTLAVLTVAQAARRAVHYAIERPAREVLFTVLRRDEKYKAKGFVDTVVYRGSDAASAWAMAALVTLGFAAVAAAALPLTGAWLLIVAWLARRHREKERSHDPT